MPPVASIEPSRIWHRRAALFSCVLLTIVLVAGYQVPYVLLLAPFAAYRAAHAFRFLQPGKVGIDLYDEKLTTKPAFGKHTTLERSEVRRFLPVYRGSTEVVVARVRDVNPKGSAGCDLFHNSDIVMPCGLMRNPGLVRRLETWRMGTFTMDSLIPGQVQENQ